MPEAVVTHVKPGKAALSGGLFGFCAAIMIFAATLPVWFGAPFHFLVLFGLGVGLIFAACAAYFIGIALKRPVALRMDANGISGFYADPATWDEISGVDVFEGHKSRLYLRFTLGDPGTSRPRQSQLRRLTAFNLGQRKRHILVPETVLAHGEVKALARQAKALHSAAKGAEDLHLTSQP